MYRKERQTAANVPIVSIIAAQSNTGKTTLIEGMVTYFKGKGYRLGVLKHHVHKEIELDKEGKDSYRFAHAGADAVIISSPHKVLMMETVEKERELDQVLSMFADVDLILVEGYKGNRYPKIEVFRQAAGEKLTYDDPKTDKSQFLAIASDVDLDVDLPLLPLNNPDRVGEFIEKKCRLVEKKEAENEDI